ncbi:MAG: CBS domain-containing protein, partial [Thermoplasmata archaeon]
MKKDRLIKEFYDLKVKDLMDHRYWDLPVVEKDTDIA